MADSQFTLRSHTEAKALGVTRFFTGQPCRRGHIAEFMVRNGDCVQCILDGHLRRYHSLTAQQKLERSRRNTSDRKAKHGIDGVRAQARLYAQKYRANPENRRALHNKWQRHYSRAKPEKKIFRHAMERARILGVPFTLRESDIHVPKVCPVLGISMHVGTGRQHDGSPSLDRFVPELGYVPDNISVISLRANRIKQNASPEELEKVASWMRARATWTK